MTSMALTQSLVALTEKLTDDFDVIDVLGAIASQCARLCDSAGAGLLLADPDGQLYLAASSDQSPNVVEGLELRARDRPCLDCYSTGTPTAEDLTQADESRDFVLAALESGFRSVHTLPLRIHGDVIGTLEVLRECEGRLTDKDAELAQALAHLAALAVVLNRHMGTLHVATQLDLALKDRMLVEQAKGLVCERTAQEPAWVDTAMRAYARHHRLRVAEVAQRVVDGHLDFLDLDPFGPSGEVEEHSDGSAV